MTKEDVKEFFHENKKDIEFVIALTATCVVTYAFGAFMYKSGYVRGVSDVSDNIHKLLGSEKYDQLLVAMTKMFEGKQT